MLSLEQITSQYPPILQAFKKNILREYLQYKILEIIFETKYAGKLSFLGGTALRIVHQNTRFSEDIDFDNFSLTEEEFNDLSHLIQKGLKQEGLETEVRNVFKNAYRCYIKIPKLLHQNNLSAQQEEKILIQIDTVPHNFPYTPDQIILNKFDVFTKINVTPPPLLLSQKIYAAFNRPRPKGRDFYDIIFLLSLNIEPNYKYLKKNLKISNKEQLRSFILAASQDLNFLQLAKDLKPFLFNPKDSKKIELFTQYLTKKTLP